MRTDVKIGLICVFAIVLAVVIYFVAQGNAKPREAKAGDSPTMTTPHSTASNTPSTPAAPAKAPSISAPAETGLTVSAPAATPSVAAAPTTPLTGMQLAQADTFRGGTIAPPSAPGSTPAIAPSAPGAGSLSAPPATPGTPSAPSFGTPTPLTGGTSIIPAAPGSGATTRPSYGAPTIEPAARSADSHLSPLPAPGSSALPAGPRSNISGRSPYGASSTFSTPSSGNSLTGTSAAGGNTYTIQKGDILTTIAKKNNTTVKAIEAANPGIDPNHLKIKQVIHLPAAGTAGNSTAGSSTVAAGGTSARHATISDPAPTFDPPASPSHTSSASSAARSLKPGATYTIKRGDSLQTIAQAAYGSKSAWKRIFRANRSELGDANTIPVGTTIRLPE
jgi:LysM repeat protein